MAPASPSGDFWNRDACGACAARFPLQSGWQRVACVPPAATLQRGVPSPSDAAVSAFAPTAQRATQFCFRRFVRPRPKGGAQCALRAPARARQNFEDVKSQHCHKSRVTSRESWEALQPARRYRSCVREVDSFVSAILLLLLFARLFEQQLMKYPIVLSSI